MASLTSSAATFVAAGDLDANGLPDFMFSDSAGELHRCLNPDWAGVGTPTQPYSHGYFVNHPDFESTTPNTTTNALAGANCPVINHGWQIFPQLQSAW